MRFLALAAALLALLLCGCQRRTLSDEQAQGLANADAGIEAAHALATAVPPADEQGHVTLTEEQAAHLVDLVTGAHGWMIHSITNLDLPQPAQDALALYQQPQAARRYAIAGEAAARDPAPAGQSMLAIAGGIAASLIASWIGLRAVPGSGAALSRMATTAIAAVCEGGQERGRLITAVKQATAEKGDRDGTDAG